MTTHSRLPYRVHCKSRNSPKVSVINGGSAGPWNNEGSSTRSFTTSVMVDIAADAVESLSCLPAQLERSDQHFGPSNERPAFCSICCRHRPKHSTFCLAFGTSAGHAVQGVLPKSSSNTRWSSPNWCDRQKFWPTSERWIMSTDVTMGTVCLWVDILDRPAPGIGARSRIQPTCPRFPYKPASRLSRSNLHMALTAPRLPDTLRMSIHHKRYSTDISQASQIPLHFNDKYL